MAETSKTREAKPAGRLGISPLGWTNDVLTDLGGDIPLETFLQDASEIGYAGVELGRKFPRSAQELLPKLAQYQLQLISGWYSGFLAQRSLDEEWQAAADHVGLLKDCGCNLLIYGECGLMAGDSPWDLPISVSPKLESLNLQNYAEKIGEFAIRLLRRDMKLAYHYHLKMLVETADEIFAFLKATSEEVGLLLDTGHAYAAGAHYGEVIRRFGSRIVHIHLKDVRKNVLDWARRNDVSFNSAVREGLFTVPGEGEVDFSQVADFVHDSRYDGWLVVEAEQDPAKSPPKLNAQKAFRYVSDLM